MDSIKSLNAPPSTIFNSILTIPLLIFFLTDCFILQISSMKSSTIPIRVALKPKCCKWSKNVFHENRGFPEKTDNYNNCLHNINGGVILRQKSLLFPNLMLLIRNPTMTSMKPCMVLSWPRTWMFPTSTLLKPRNSLPWSKNIGPSLMSTGHSLPCVATSVWLTQEMLNQLQLRKSCVASKKW